MGYPSFTAGEILTSADMNAVGVWLVKEQVIGSAVSSVTVTDAFSADYDSYRIIINGGLGSTDTGSLNVTLGATATGYSRGGTYGSWNSTTVSAVSNENAANWTATALFTTNNISCDITLHNPYLAQRTVMAARAARTVAAGLYVDYVGYLDNTTSYTAITFTTAAGTITGGTIRIYGYRN